jgi:ATP phosphoribosyltransferase regulatory subunit
MTTPVERWQQIPAGTRDLLPQEAAGVRAVTDAVLRVAARWGYREVATPTVEYLEALVRGEGPGAGDRLFKLIDRGGEVLALRPEMTTPVARLVATRLGDEPRPLRLAYAGQVFRGRDAGSGRLREFPQVGCELIGAGTVEADAEIVALAVEALRAGRRLPWSRETERGAVAQCSLSLGHVGVLRAILAGLDLPEDDATAVRGFLYQKDFVGIRDVLDRRGAAAGTMEALLTLPALRGPTAIAEARRLVELPDGQRALSELAELEEILRAYGVGDAVTIDLSIIRDFDYYTGIVFEGHTASLGVPLLGGGRYDRLVDRFGAPCPATGFAVRVERLLAVAPRAPDRWAPDVAVAFTDGGRNDAVACARALRARGLVVTVEVLGRPWEEVAREAIDRGTGRVVLVGPATVVVREADGSERAMPAAKPELLAGALPVSGGPR